MIIHRRWLVISYCSTTWSFGDHPNHRPDIIELLKRNTMKADHSWSPPSPWPDNDRKQPKRTTLQPLQQSNLCDNRHPARDRQLLTSQKTIWQSRKNKQRCSVKICKSSQSRNVVIKDRREKKKTTPYTQQDKPEENYQPYISTKFIEEEKNKFSKS